MRSFDERKAEILKRSEKIIKERKRRRKEMLTVCISLAVCISVLSVLSIPKINLNKKDNIENTATSNSATYLYTSLEITECTVTGSESKKHTAKADVQNVYSIVQSCFSDKDPSGNDNFSGNSATDIKGALSFTITFKSKDGTSLVFTLEGKTLTNTATSQKVTLTEDKYSQLLASIKGDSK